MSDSLGVGARFGPYLLKRLVGSGGMGSVFEAEDTVLQRSVALKLISATFAQDPDYRERLQREARIAGRLHDPHVVPIHGAGEIDGQLYVEMRLINGVDLDTTLRRSGPLLPPRAVAIVSQIASALDDAHAAGVLHRDVKPANILLTANDFAYLVDFGIANAAAESKLTQLGDVLGTWAYMAPERFSGDNAVVTGSADVYALACVLFETLTGSPPFSGDQVSLMGAHLSQSPPRPSVTARVPGAMDDVIARGMAKLPEHRYATAGDLARAAAAAIGAGAMFATTSPIAAQAQPVAPWGVPGPAQVSGPPPHFSASSFANPANTTKGKARKRWLLIAAAVVMVVALAGSIAVWRLTGGKSTDKSATAIDLSKLDVGHYGTQPRTLPANPTEEEGRFLAAFSIAEGIVNPYDVDHKLSHLTGVAAPDPKLAASILSPSTLSPIVQPVLQQYGMITAYGVVSLSTEPADIAAAPT
jgi:serine/threonine protein kinase